MTEQLSPLPWRRTAASLSAAERRQHSGWLLREAENASILALAAQGVAIKETGPRETVARYGEVYAFAPATVVVHRDEPTLIEFWNLQPDDDHDFMLMDPQWSVMMKVMLPALKKTSYIFTFHEEGLFNFFCVMHPPAMNGQILVLPPIRR